MRLYIYTNHTNTYITNLRYTSFTLTKNTLIINEDLFGSLYKDKYQTKNTILILLIILNFSIFSLTRDINEIKISNLNIEKHYKNYNKN